MSNWRIKYGAAFGPEGSAGLNSANQLLTPGDTTPDVSNGTYFVTANTSQTTITYFDLIGKGGIDPVAQNNGKVIHIQFQDALTKISGASVLTENDIGNYPVNSVVDFVHYNSVWIQRGQASTKYLRANIVANGSATLNVTTANIVNITSLGASLGVLGFTGGASNQTITVFFQVTGGQAVSFAQSAGNLYLAGTNGFVASGSAGYPFYTLNGVQWYSGAGLLSP